MPLLPDFDDVDYFRSTEQVIDGLRMDTSDVKKAMVSIVNILGSRSHLFIGDLSIEIQSSIERTEKIVAHLEGVNVVKRLNVKDLESLGFNDSAVVFALDRVTVMTMIENAIK